MEKKSFFDKLKSTLRNTGGGLLAGLFASDTRINSAFFDELEEAMIVADMGVDVAMEEKGVSKVVSARFDA